MFDHQIILVLAHYLIVSYYPCVASLSCRRRTRATRCVTPIPFYTKIDAQCDKLATVELSWQRLRRSMCSGKIVQLRGKVLQYWIHCHFELPATSYRRICLLLSATLKIFIMLNDINHEFCHFHFVAHSNNEDKAETGWKLCIHRKNQTRSNILFVFQWNLHCNSSSIYCPMPTVICGGKCLVDKLTLETQASATCAT